MKLSRTRIVVVLDRSGSMTSLQDATIQGFNDFIDGQKLEQGDVDVLLVQFDDQYEIAFDLPLAEVPLLDRKTFVPRGSTALHDALGRTITMLMRQLASLPEATRHSRVVVVTLTDGQENSSQLYSGADIAEMVLKQHETCGWEFIYLGANQDGVAVGASMNIPMRSSMSYAAGTLGTASILNAASREVTRFRQGAAPEFSEADRRNAQREDTASIL